MFWGEKTPEYGYRALFEPITDKQQALIERVATARRISDNRLYGLIRRATMTPHSDLLSRQEAAWVILWMRNSRKIMPATPFKPRMIFDPYPHDLNPDGRPMWITVNSIREHFGRQGWAMWEIREIIRETVRLRTFKHLQRITAGILLMELNTRFL